jgi:P27 family predicted phage terminase small subunit
MGRPALPTNVHLLRGDDKKNPKRINRSEPQPSGGEVTPPSWLSRKARAVWRRLAPDLEAKKVLTPWDREAFANYCDAVARRAEAAKALQKEGQVIDAPVFNKNGDLTGHRRARNPWSLELRDADAQVQRWGARFGLTPSERSQIKLPQGGSGGDDLLS